MLRNRAIGLTASLTLLLFAGAAQTGAAQTTQYEWESGFEELTENGLAYVLSFAEVLNLTGVILTQTEGGVPKEIREAVAGAAEPLKLLINQAQSVHLDLRSLPKDSGTRSLGEAKTLAFQKHLSEMVSLTEETANLVSAPITDRTAARTFAISAEALLAQANLKEAVATAGLAWTKSTEPENALYRYEQAEARHAISLFKNVIEDSAGQSVDYGSLRTDFLLHAAQGRELLVEARSAAIISGRSTSLKSILDHEERQLGVLLFLMGTKSGWTQRETTSNNLAERHELWRAGLARWFSHLLNRSRLREPHSPT